MIEIIDLSKSYYTKSECQPVLQRVNMTLPNKGFISVLGKSGSGKTTLLNILGGIDKFEEGSILYNNVDISKFNSSEWDLFRSNHLSFVFQEDNLIDSFTVRENLEFVIDRRSYSLNDDRIESLLSKFELLEKLDKKPNELSGGEKQRIALIRALLKKSEVLLVDEPTGSLDEENAVVVLDFLKEISKEKLVFMITHDQEYAEQYSDEMIYIKNGQIVQSKDVTENETIQFSVNNLKPLNLKNSQVLRLVMNGIKSNLSKIIQYTLLLTVTLFMIGLGFSTLFTDEYSIAGNTLMNTNMEYIFIESPVEESYDQTDFDFWITKLNSQVSKNFNAYNIYYRDAQGMPLMNVNYDTSIQSLMYYNNEVILSYGNAPSETNEVVISDYTATGLLKSNLLTGSDISKLVGKKLPYSEMVITGIYETDYSNYEYMLNEDEYFYNSDKFKNEDKSQFLYKKNNFYSTLFVDESFDFSLTNISQKALSSDKTNYLSLRVNPITSEIESDLTQFSELVLSERDIYLSRYVVYNYIQELSIFNFHSYEEFITYWLEHEEEITNYVIGKEIKFSFEVQSQTYYGGDVSYNDSGIYTIKGIYNNTSPSDEIYISRTLYNTAFKDNFSIVVYLIDKDLISNETILKAIRDEGYFYVFESSNRIIQYMDRDGRILSLLAFSISGVFMFFSLLLFNNLISRDIYSKKKEIGLLRSLGIKQRQVAKLFIFEVLIMALFAYFFALLLLLMGIKLLNILVSSEKGLTIINYDIRMVLALFLMTMIFTSLSIIRPMRKLSKLSLVEAIRGNKSY